MSPKQEENSRRSIGIDARKLTHFLRELDQFSRAVGISTTNRNYRHQYPEERMCFFFYRVPMYEHLGSGTPSLPATGFAPQTVMLALSDFSWQFVYNGQQIKLCDCTGAECQMPLNNRLKEILKDGTHTDKGQRHKHMLGGKRDNPG